MTIGILSYSECGSGEYPLHSLYHCIHNVLIELSVSLGGHLDIFFLVVGPRRSATCVNCALKALLLRATYCLTMQSATDFYHSAIWNQSVTRIVTVNCANP